jgi:hypothetical protein
MWEISALALGKKPSCFVYFIGDEGGILIHLEKGVVSRRLFAPAATPEHLAPFAELLNEHPKLPVYGLVDVIDQSYVRHSMPPVTSLGVNRLVQRRISRDFPKENINGALPLGREKSGRKEWLFLLISLATSPDLSGWIGHISSLENRFSGIYLVPVECEYFLATLHSKYLLSTGVKPEKKKRGKKQVVDKDSWLILVSHHKTGGVRQVVLKNNQLIFTRLTQSPDANSPEILAGSIEQEITNTLEYLKRLSYTSNDDLSVYGIISPESKDLVNLSLEGRGGQYKMFSPFDVAQLFKLEQAVLSADKYGDVVLGTAFAMAAKKRLRLYPPQLEALNKLYGIKNSVKWVGGALIVAMLGLIGTTYLEWDTATQGKRDEEAKLSQLQAELESIKERTANLPADVNKIAGLITLDDQLTAREGSALGTLEKLSTVIRDDQLINKIEWMKDGTLSGTANQNHELKLVVEFTVIEETWEAFIAKTKAFNEALKTTFTEYDVVMPEVSNTSETNQGSETVINFEDETSDNVNNADEMETKKITVDVTMKRKNTPQ